MSMEAICGSKSVVGSVCARARVCVCRGGGGEGEGSLSATVLIYSSTEKFWHKICSRGRGSVPLVLGFIKLRSHAMCFLDAWKPRQMKP